MIDHMEQLRPKEEVRTGTTARLDAGEDPRELTRLICGVVVQYPPTGSNRRAREPTVCIARRIASDGQ